MSTASETFVPKLPPKPYKLSSRTRTSAETFHVALHNEVVDVGLRLPAVAHTISWAGVMVNLVPRRINIEVYLKFKKENNLSDADYKKLIGLARSGIDEYWSASRPINIGGNLYQVNVASVVAEHRAAVNVLEVDLTATAGRNVRQSSALSSPEILEKNWNFNNKARFIYSREFSKNTVTADNEFRLTVAYTFGYSVLNRNDFSPTLFSRKILGTAKMNYYIKRLIWGAELVIIR